MRFFKMWTDDKDVFQRTHKYLFYNDENDPDPVIPKYWLLFTYRDGIGPLLKRDERERDLINLDDDNQIPRGKCCFIVKSIHRLNTLFNSIHF